jgi:DNA-binding GntR family transcriptional regulator
VPPRDRIQPSKRVADALRIRLESGEWQSGEQLPSVAAFADEYDTSRATVSKALAVLASEGLIEIVPAWGTFRV